MFKIPHIDFMGKRYIAGSISGLLIIISLVSLSIQGLNLGLDFTGGTVIEVQFDQPITPQAVKALLQSDYPKALVQHFGSTQDIVIRLATSYNTDIKQTISQLIHKGAKIGFIVQRIEYIGPHIGEELKEQVGLGLLVAFLVIMLYVAFRFQIKFSVSAIAALLHDIIITLGIFSLFSLKFDLTVLAAILAIIGYSLNDSIVISDRIRENFRRKRKRFEAKLVINDSLNDVLGRTIVTSITTLLVVIALFIVGGSSIHGFSMAMIIGIIIGSYSSIYVVANLLLTMNLNKDNLTQSAAEKALLDSRP